MMVQCAVVSRLVGSSQLVRLGGKPERTVAETLVNGINQQARGWSSGCQYTAITLTGYRITRTHDVARDYDTRWRFTPKDLACAHVELTSTVTFPAPSCAETPARMNKTRQT